MYGTILKLSTMASMISISIEKLQTHFYEKMQYCQFYKACLISDVQNFQNPGNAKYQPDSSRWSVSIFRNWKVRQAFVCSCQDFLFSCSDFCMFISCFSYAGVQSFLCSCLSFWQFMSKHS